MQGEIVKKFLLSLTALFLVVGTAFLSSANQEPKTPNYRAVPTGLKLPAGFAFANITGVATDANDRIYVSHGGKTPLVVFDKNGAFVRGWGTGLVKSSHYIRVDPEGNVWTTDRGHHIVVKYDLTGKVLLTLGTKGTPGESETQFNIPADMAFAPNGDVYVADGYGNSRVVQFSKEGKFLRAWGKRGKGPGDFNLPHAIFYDAKTNQVFVCDRSNKRVQIFDAQGKFVTQWNNIGTPYGLFVHKGEHVFLSDGAGNAVRKLDLKGMTLARWGSKGKEAGQFENAHGICVDSRGTVYVAEGTGKRIQKFVAVNE